MTVAPLDRKLLRDLKRLWAQVLAIALVIASGVGLMIMALGSVESLKETGEAYYERYRFAEVFSSLTRAPAPLAERIALIPGVQSVQTRVVEFATIDIQGFAEPVTARLVSHPGAREAVLNRLALRKGRLPETGRDDEVVVNEPFAEAHGLNPGDRVNAVINGRERALRVVGIALSPEYVYAIGPGQIMPDDARFGILWMEREALAAAFDLDGAFNDVALSLYRGASEAEVIDRLDALLDPYGGTGAIARADQTSNWFLQNEIRQLYSMATILPAVFLAVAAFLTNMVMGRLIATERSQIGLMKAFGYRNAHVALHYAKLVLLMALPGIVLGWALGYWLGRYNTELYTEFFQFPLLYYRPGVTAFALASLISLAAAMAGALTAVRAAARLAPAEAMRPPSPPRFHAGPLTGGRLAGLFDQPTRIILRQINRNRMRALLTVAGIAASLGVLVSALQWLDSIERTIQLHFFESQHQDATAGLVEVQSSAILRAFETLPGVLESEGSRVVAARLVVGHRKKRIALTGVPSGARLNPVYDVSGEVVEPRGEGLVLSTKLAELVGLQRGDWVRLEVLEGRRPSLRLPVVRLFETNIGTPAYMNLAALNSLMAERPSVNSVELLIDARYKDRLFAELKGLPKVSAVTLREAAVQTFRDTLAETILIFIFFFVAFSCALAVGVVYNGARISLSERGRELATLRVLGFGRAEIAYILLGEMALLSILAVPLGCLFGRALAWVFATAFDTELYRVPLVIEPSTYGLAAAIILAASAASMALVARRIRHLDLIAVLKTRE